MRSLRVRALCEQVLGEQIGLELSPSIELFGNTLMDQKPIKVRGAPRFGPRTPPADLAAALSRAWFGQL